MNKVINKKIGILVLSAILLLAVMVTPFPEAAATHKDNAEHGGGPGGGGGGPGGGGGGPGGGGGDDGGGSETPEFICHGMFGYEDDPNAEDILWDGNVVVQDGALCNLYAMDQSIHITGDLKVAAGGELWVYGGYDSDKTITIDGDIVADGADEVHILNVYVGGSVTVKDTVNGFLLANSEIIGDVKLNDNYYAYSVEGNEISGNLALSNNEGGGYGFYHNFSGNIIDGNLQCKNNSPDPTSSGGNSVSGKVTGQCKELV